MRPEQMLDMQADLLERIERDQRFVQYVKGVLVGGNAAGSELAAQMIAGLRQAARLALAYRVTPDMSLLVEHAASTLDETDRFVVDLAPSEFGLVHFERPLPVIDARNKTMLAHWVAWGRAYDANTGKVVSLAYWFNDQLLGPDEVARMEFQADGRARVLGLMGRWGFLGGDAIQTGQQVGEMHDRLTPDQAAAILADGDTPTPFTNTRRYLHALWMLMGQAVASRHDEHVRSTAVKRAHRRGLNPRVTVITLRRSEGSRHEGESLVAWSHRWLVRGHPRWQPYGTRQGHLGDHVLGPVEVTMGHSVRYCTIAGCDHEVRRIWIAPFVKGPDGAPLRMRDHVYDLRR